MKTLLTSIFILTSLIFIPFAVKAVNMSQILGRVTIKETGRPLSRAKIIFENGFDKITVKTTDSGDYYSDHMPIGSYQMRVVYNNRTFIMNHVRAYDGYDTEINFAVSNDTSLPATVVLETPDPIISSVTSPDIQLRGDPANQGTQSFSDILSNMPGVTLSNGNIYVRGSQQLHIFIDGEPVLAPPVIRNW